MSVSCQRYSRRAGCLASNSGPEIKVMKGRYLSRMSSAPGVVRNVAAMGSSGEDSSKLELGKIVEVSGKGLGVVAARGWSPESTRANKARWRYRSPAPLGVRCCRRRAARGATVRDTKMR